MRNWTAQKILFAIGAEMLVLFGLFIAAVPGGLSTHVIGWFSFLVYGGAIIGVRIALVEHAIEVVSSRLRRVLSRRIWVPVLCGLCSWLSWTVCMVTIAGHLLGGIVGTLPFGVLSAVVAAQCTWSR